MAIFFNKQISITKETVAQVAEIQEAEQLASFSEALRYCIKTTYRTLFQPTTSIEGSARK